MITNVESNSRDSVLSSQSMDLLVKHALKGLIVDTSTQRLESKREKIEIEESEVERKREAAGRDTWREVPT